MTALASIDQRVTVAVDAWLRWVPSWRPGVHRSRIGLCRRCTGSPILSAAGVAVDVPHQVKHALVSRMQRIVDHHIDEFTAARLPGLHAELVSEQLWRVGGYDPLAGLGPEYEGIDPDPVPDEGGQPFLFTLAGLAEQSELEPVLPRPPLNAEEKDRIRREIELADVVASEIGGAVCGALVSHRGRIRDAVLRFIEPQIQAMLDELACHLESPQ